MGVDRRGFRGVHIPVVYVAVDCASRAKRLPIEEVRRRWRQLLAKVREARERDGN